MSATLKKLIMVLAVSVFILFIILLIAAWNMGAFAPVEVTSAERGPYYFVSLHHKGSYSQIVEKIQTVENMLKEKNIPFIRTAGIFYDNPAYIKPEDLRSNGGCIVSDSVKVDTPFVFMTIPKRQVAIAKIEASPAIAPFKTYPALFDWMQENDMVADEGQITFEMYFTEGFVEVEMPIKIVEEK